MRVRMSPKLRLATSVRCSFEHTCIGGSKSRQGIHKCTPTDKHAFDIMQFGVKAHEPHAIAFVDAKLVSLDSSLSQMNRTCYDNRRIPLYKMCHINRPMILTIVRVPYIGAGILRQGSLSVASLCDHVVDTRLVLCCPMCHISN